MPKEEAEIARNIFQLGADYTKKLTDLLSGLEDKEENRPYFILVEFLGLLLHLTSRLTFKTFPPKEHDMFMNSTYRELLGLIAGFLEQSEGKAEDRDKLLAYSAAVLNQREEEYGQAKGFFLKKDPLKEKPIFWRFSGKINEAAGIEGAGITGEVLADQAVKELGAKLSDSLSI